MKIYFIRHGEAEIYAEDDFKRKLTTIGRVKLENSFKAFANNLEDKRSYKIYSSPLERAKELQRFWPSTWTQLMKSRTILQEQG